MSEFDEEDDYYPPDPKTLKEACQQAIDDFDFDKAADFYDMMHWEWVNQGVPGAEAIEELATRLMRSLDPPECTETRSGGLTCKVTGDGVELQFVAIEGGSSYCDPYTMPRT